MKLRLIGNPGWFRQLNRNVARGEVVECNDPAAVKELVEEAQCFELVKEPRGGPASKDE